jgi:hypothetical protein
MDRVPVFERNVARGGLCIVEREEGERPCGGGSLWVGHGHVMHVSVRHPSIISVWTHVPAPSTEAVRTFDFFGFEACFKGFRQRNSCIQNSLDFTVGIVKEF